ncbi:FkbM family methyltransferase [Hydrogenophaga intermedia]|uniref:FkbM family methyltransferase n=1 Tax=Hydrogenophaga intermedia TaxID=65786 RepID=UPI002042F73C|nr:FkbM family methyltransferase [Hydrogenophaga intermedia]
MPDHPGKWKLWTIASPRLRAGYFEPGIYTTLMGLKMVLRPEQYIDRFIYLWGEWEPDETHIIRRILRPGDRFVDIGANAGYFTLLAANIVGKDGQVDAFEPVPTTAQLLRENIARNSLTNVRVHECAASQAEGSVFIYQHGAGGISGQNSMRAVQETNKGWTVETRRVDQVLASKPSIRLIKLDVEGAELLALSGASALLSGDDAPIVLCEVTDSFMREIYGNEDELFKFIEQYGCSYIYDIHNRKMKMLGQMSEKLRRCSATWCLQNISCKFAVADPVPSFRAI